MRTLLTCLFVLGMTCVAFAANCGGGIVCQCGDTVTKPYVLPADLGPCAHDGLIVMATLDGNKHVVTGMLGRESVGVLIRGVGVKVKNIETAYFERGIEVAASGVTVSNFYSRDVGNFVTHVGYGVTITHAAQGVKLLKGRVNYFADEGIHVGSGAGNIEVREVVFENPTTAPGHGEQAYVLNNVGDVNFYNCVFAPGMAIYAKRTLPDGKKYTINLNAPTVLGPLTFRVRS